MSANEPAYPWGEHGTALGGLTKRELIAAMAMQGLAEGKQIQGLMAISGKWEDMHDMHFNGPADQYRIKPEPKEIWVNRQPNGTESVPYPSEDVALLFAGFKEGVIQVRYREVIE